MPAGIALDAQESVFEAPAFQVRLELFDDEVGERDTFGVEPFEKPREVLFDEGVEGSLPQAVTFVRECVTGESQSGAGGHRLSAVMGVVLTMRSGSGVVIENSVPSGVGHRLAVTCLQSEQYFKVGSRPMSAKSAPPYRVPLPAGRHRRQPVARFRAQPGLSARRRVHGDDFETIDPLVEQVASYHVDHAVLTVGGIDAENGLTNYEVEAASLARATMRQVTSTTVLADSQKMGRTALAKVCDLVNVDRVVTDREPRPEIRRAMEAADVELIVADRDG